MFKPLRYGSGKLVEMECATTVTIAKGNALEDNGSGYLALGTSSSQNITHVAMETVTTTANGQKVLCIDVQGVEFLADCGEVWSTTDVGTLCDLHDEDQLNPDGSSHDIFYIRKGVGVAETGTQVIGYFRQQSDA